MTGPIDTPGVGEVDQLRAATRDLAAALRLEVADRISVTPEWVEQATGPELLDALTERALVATAAGELLALVAVPLGDDAVSVGVLVVRRGDGQAP